VPWVHTCHPKPHLTVTLESSSSLTLVCPMPSSVSSRESHSMSMFPRHFSQCSYFPTRPICRTLRALDRWPRSRTHLLPQQRPKTKCSPQRSTWHYHANRPHVSCATNLAEPKCVTVTRLYSPSHTSSSSAWSSLGQACRVVIWPTSRMPEFACT